MTWNTVTAIADLTEGVSTVRLLYPAPGDDGETHLTVSVEGTYEGGAINPDGSAYIAIMPDPAAPDLTAEQRAFAQKAAADRASGANRGRHLWGPLEDGMLIQAKSWFD